MPYIYKITNKINGKCYIGQTIKAVQTRWNEHKRVAFQSDKISYKYPLYKAFRKYGIDNFTFEIIENCKVENLNEREIYWINYYNSTNSEKGYNQSLGGGGLRKLKLDENLVIKKYLEFQNLKKVSLEFNCSPDSITQILLKNNVKIISAKDHAINKSYEVKQYDKNYNLINTFKNRRYAAEWLINNGIKSNQNSIKIAIRAAILTECLSYGYYWTSDNYSEEYKQNFIKRKKLKDKKHNLNRNKKNKCPICGNPMSTYSTMCMNCSKNKKKELAIQSKQEKGITRIFLKDKIRTESFTSIGREFNVGSNTIKKWCKLFNLPYRTKDIKQYTDEEWKLL